MLVAELHVLVRVLTHLVFLFFLLARARRILTEDGLETLMI
jgi:hypothetical protein